MSKKSEHSLATVVATVYQVMPKLGLAYVADDKGTEWAVTKSTQGMALHELTVGGRVRLVVERHPKFSVVRECIPHS